MKTIKLSDILNEKESIYFYNNAGVKNIRPKRVFIYKKHFYTFFDNLNDNIVNKLKKRLDKINDCEIELNL